MAINKEQVRNILSKYVIVLDVEQQGSKQLFIVKVANQDMDIKLLVSYLTVIGYCIPPYSWIVTDKKYSVTTSKQLSTSGLGNKHSIEHDKFVKLIALHLNLTLGQADYLASK